ncbi:TIGR01244 family sulfur transferase [Shimia sp. Alg240-R146]|uniref:TIGR01244 family sulfur transferase n=1 Tax=Shimia sp. Alg240-R146 TaxID=2993449 RepID=UPI0022E744D8|nr:TIGR01244 family sulfur transferase [Shimia sp. Alg240-R146]
MNIRQITDRFFVAPQIEATDMQALAEAGFSLVINNRPDMEVGPDQASDAMQAAAEAAGLSYVANPLTMETMTPDRQSLQGDSAEGASGKVLAYCRSGTRSAICWTLSQAGKMPADDLLAATAAAGYDLSGLEAHLRAQDASN